MVCLLKGGIFLKKIFILFLTLILTFLCSCRSTKENDNLTSSKKSDIITSDFSSTTSDIQLPNRDLPDDDTNSDSANSSESTGSTDTESSVSVSKVSLTIETDNTYYLTSAKVIGFVLSNKNKKSFTYQTDYFLQYYNDKGNWEYVKTKSDEIEYSYNTAESKSHVEFVSFDLRELYDLPLTTGTYRIVLENGDETIASNSFQFVSNNFFDGGQQ